MLELVAMAWLLLYVLLLYRKWRSVNGKWRQNYKAEDLCGMAPSET